MIQKWIFVAIGCLLLVFAVSAQTQSRSSDNTIEGQYIVRLADNSDIEVLKKYLQPYASDAIAYLPIMREPFHIWLIDFGSETSFKMEAIIQKYEGTISVFKNRKLQARAIPNDPLITKQWQYNNTGVGGGLAGADMSMYKAWDIATGGVNYNGDTIVVCVIDDGVNGNHEDLKDNMWINHHEIPDNGIDDDNNGYVDDYLGWNVKFNNDSLYNGGSHGTPVAGIIGARGNNAIGVSGVNWNVKILPINYGDATEANALASYAYAYTMRKQYNETNGEKGAFIVATNTSWGIDKAQADEAPLWCSLYDSMGDIGIINIAATTNSNTDVDIEGDLPTSCTSPFLITVTNINNVDQKVSNAGYGRKSIDLGAYGQQVYTINRTSYGTFGGTSGAAPHVTGVMALLYAIQCPTFDSIVKTNPGGAAFIARDMLLYGVVNLPSLNNVTTSGGKLNAFRALTNMKAICSDNVLPAGITIVPSSESIIVNWIVGSEYEITLRYRKVDDQDWIVIQNFKNGDSIPNLLYCTEYEIQLGSNTGLMSGDFGYSTFIHTEGCCQKPEIYNITTSDNQITFSIKSSSEASYIISYIDFNLKDTILAVTDTDRFVLDSIPGCYAYSFRIQAQCMPYNNTSPFTEAQFISTQCGSCTEYAYCNDFHNSSSQEWIESFFIGEEVMVSGQSPSGYSNFAGTTVFKLDRNADHNFTLNAGYKSSSFAERFKVFIDLNQDGIWDADELLFKTKTPFRNQIIDSFYIPVTAKTGYTRMRIMLSYEDFEDACEKNNFEYGEVEDYCVIIESSCGANAQISIITTMDSAIYNIQYPDDIPDQTTLFWRIVESDTWSTTLISDSIVVLPGLTKCTKYEYFLRYICADSDTSITEINIFETACNGSVVQDISGIQVYPNPVGEFLYLNINRKEAALFDFKITNMVGYSQQIHVNSDGDNLIRIDVSHLKSGMYFLNIKSVSDITSTTIKIIKM